MDLSNAMTQEPGPAVLLDDEASCLETVTNDSASLVLDTTGELLIALSKLPKYRALISTIDAILAETSDVALHLQSATRRMLVRRRAARAAAARLAEKQALAAAQLQLAARLRAESKANAARAAG